MEPPKAICRGALLFLAWFPFIPQAVCLHGEGPGSTRVGLLGCNALSSPARTKLDVCVCILIAHARAKFLSELGVFEVRTLACWCRANSANGGLAFFPEVLSLGHCKF